jgi:hypothetical protein
MIPFRTLPATLWAWVTLCTSCHNKVAQTGQLKQQKFIFLKFWGLEIQIKCQQSWLFLKLLPWLVSGHLLHGLTWPFHCVCVLISS